MTSRPLAVSDDAPLPGQPISASLRSSINPPASPPAQTNPAQPRRFLSVYGRSSAHASTVTSIYSLSLSLLLRRHGGAAHLHGRAPHAARQLCPVGGGAAAPGRGRARRRHPRRRPRQPRPRRRRRPDRRRLQLPRLLPGAQPRAAAGGHAGSDGGGARLLPPLAGGEGQALLRRPGQEDAPLHQLQRAQGDRAQLARLPPPALPPARAVRPGVASQSAALQGCHEHILQRGPGARVPALLGDIGEPGSGAGLHQEGPRRAGAAHGGELLPKVPVAGADLWPPGAHGPQRPHHPDDGRAGCRAAGAQGRPVDRCQPAAQCARHQSRRPAAGAEQREI